MENYFWNTEENYKEKKLYILVIYDIVNNRRRVAFAKKMNGYGLIPRTEVGIWGYDFGWYVSEADRWDTNIDW